MMSKVISIWSEENSLERIVMCLTNSGTEVMSKSSIVELSFTDHSWRNNDVVVGSLFYKWVSGVALALLHSSTILPLMPPSCAWFSLSIVCYMCQDVTVTIFVGDLTRSIFKRHTGHIGVWTA